MFGSTRDSDAWGGSWSELGEGAPTIAAFAQLCARALAEGPQPEAPLSAAAEAILYAARHRGVLAIKGSHQAFEAPERFLSVEVELADDATLVFRSRNDAMSAVGYLEAFRELCVAGLLLHHLFRDFSLSGAGLARAAQVPWERVAAQLEQLAADQMVRLP